MSGRHVDVLDVGHGSCALVTDGTHAVVVDCGRGAHLLEYLLQEGIEKIDTVVLSHADSDHIGGLVGLLGAKYPVRRVLMNADASKGSNEWLGLLFALEDAQSRGISVEMGPAVEGVDAAERLEAIDAEILAPRVALAYTGAGSISLAPRISTNTMSVVVKVTVNGASLMLLTGDLDYVGWELLRARKLDLRAEYLLLPHHGGMGGTKAQTSELIAALCEEVSPSQVFVSNGRGKFANPKRVVLDAVRATNPSVKLACTQLCESCSPLAVGAGVAKAYSAGSTKGHSCAGTIRLTDGDGIGTLRDTRRHDAFVDTFAATALCRQPDFRSLPERTIGELAN